ncbi:hypothetical protein FHG64_15765 [Antarcticibacterium flavum]|uniref:Lipoprotein n=1 Tax=Antarcticibacterium flavum TaxID=2058175 RepID=A0A5B7X6G4_9FLAO|nr:MULTISPECIES: hypothetical protein [Antarcticibacterium]MCM4159805.1 hypothetical protein [Antarcticibacterium sp. W02-3]QCY70730.1 hypothetical protein FHG64_15765 [Antarcticibacterium flavum]
MKFLKLFSLFSIVILMTSCATRYKAIEPEQLMYNSINMEGDVSLEYKYDVLRKKYSKKEQKKDVRLVAVKITNRSNRDMIFGDDLRLTYANDNAISLMERDKIFSSLKQKPATHLFYLLLTPLTFSTTTTNSQGITQTSSAFPAGLIVGPGLAGANLITASSANKKFKEDLLVYDMRGKTIPAGKTVYGLVGVKAGNYDALKINVSRNEKVKKQEAITP